MKDEVRINPIIIRENISKKEYKLEFNRDSIRYAEQEGFDIQNIDTKQFSTVFDLFFYSFRMHHPEITREAADRMIDTLGGLSNAVIERLASLYQKAYTSLMTGEDETKNGQMTVIL